MIGTHIDRLRAPSGRSEGAGDVGHRQAFATPSEGARRRPERRLAEVFGWRRARLTIPRIAASHAPTRSRQRRACLSTPARRLYGSLSLQGGITLAGPTDQGSEQGTNQVGDHWHQQQTAAEAAMSQSTKKRATARYDKCGGPEARYLWFVAMQPVFGGQGVGTLRYEWYATLTGTQHISFYSAATAAWATSPAWN
jgi:hypothetical protein